MKILPFFSGLPFGVSETPIFRYDPGTTLISEEVLVNTENAVFTNDGRYFVAGQHKDPSLDWGIYEIVKAASGYAVDRIVAGTLEIGSTRYPCAFDGLTSDGTCLYASATVHLQGKPTQIDYGALFRILPRADSVEVSVAHYDQDQLHLYNGMAVDPGGAIYMSNSYAIKEGDDTAIYKVTIEDHDDFTIRITPWLPVNPFRDIHPNGIQIKDDVMYYVSGKGLHKIGMTPSGPGSPTLLYTSLVASNLMDDLVILPDNRIAVAEIDVLMPTLFALPGLGINQIIIVDPIEPLTRRSLIFNSPYTVSSLAYDRGGLFTGGTLIATSYFNGGIREMRLP